MRRVGEVMKDLGFNKDAPLETQKAFIRHLIRAANGSPPIQIPEDPQLSFDPVILGTCTRNQVAKKS